MPDRLLDPRLLLHLEERQVLRQGDLHHRHPPVRDRLRVRREERHPRGRRRRTPLPVQTAVGAPLGRQGECPSRAAETSAAEVATSSLSALSGLDQRRRSGLQLDRPRLRHHHILRQLQEAEQPNSSRHDDSLLRERRHQSPGRRVCIRDHWEHRDGAEDLRPRRHHRR